MRSAILLAAVCVIASLSTGCAQPTAKGRDLNAETIEQMGFWGGSPGL
jgi:hypothetical protein